MRIRDLVSEKSYESFEEFLGYMKRRKNLVNPESYDIHGVYRFKGKDNEFSGVFEIDKNGEIVGEIEDPNSASANHLVLGKISPEDEKVRLHFRKIPVGLFSDLFYNLEKEGSDTLEGQYEGMWALDEKRIGEVENTASLNISKRKEI